MEQVCREMGARLERKGLLVSMLHSLLTLRRTPVIYVDGRLVSHGRVPRLEELHGWIEAARAA